MEFKDLANDINSYTEAQIEYHNSVSELKIYSNIKSRDEEKDIQKVEDNEVVLRGLSQEDIDKNISPLLKWNKKMSRRPC